MKVILYVCPTCQAFAVKPGKHIPCDAELVETTHWPDAELQSWISAYDNLVGIFEAQGEHYEKFMVSLCQHLGLVYEDVFYEDVLKAFENWKANEKRNLTIIEVIMQELGVSDIEELPTATTKLKTKKLES